MNISAVNSGFGSEFKGQLTSVIIVSIIVTVALIAIKKIFFCAEAIHPPLDKKNFTTNSPNTPPLISQGALSFTQDTSLNRIEALPSSQCSVLKEVDAAQLYELTRRLRWTHVEGTTFKSECGVEFRLEDYLADMLKDGYFGFSGAFFCNDKQRIDSIILLKNPDDLNTLIELLKVLNLNELHNQLEVKTDQLRELKSFYCDEVGFLPELLESLSFLTAFLNKKFYNDQLEDRASNKTTPNTLPVNQLLFHCNESIQKLPQNFASVKRFPQLNREAFLDKKAKAQLGRSLDPKLNLTVILSHSINGTMCINEEAPQQFHYLFPCGMYLVKTENDNRTNEQRLEALGEAGQIFSGRASIITE